MKLADLHGKNIAVLGAGREGLASAAYLVGKGEKVTVIDAQPENQLPKARESLGDSVEWQFGNKLENLTDFDVLVRSPGIPFQSGPVQEAIDGGIAVTSQTAIFLAESPAKVIGVSGTKGKGTTSGLIAAMLGRGGKTVHLGGNIGVPPFEFLDDVKPNDWVVLELSSYQLEDLKQSPQIAVLTNLTAEHLDYHVSVEAYRQAKQPLVKFQSPDDLAILNAEDPGSLELAELAPGQKQWFGLGDGDAVVAAGVLTVMGEPICREEDVPVPGPHNQRNVLAAALVAYELGVSPEVMAAAVKNYRGLPYHLELVGEHDGVRYFNDSYATNPTATIPAIESFTEPVVLIAGGDGRRGQSQFERSDKGLDYTELAKALAGSSVKAVVLIPPVGDTLAELIAEHAPKIGQYPITDKSQIVPKATELAKSGDVVLLSPAAASFGWFDNYGQRGEYFAGQVQKLP